MLGFWVAVNRRWLDKQSNEWKEEASFFQCNQWGASAERNSKTLHKGSPVLVQGSLRSRTWEGKDGHKNYVVEIFAQSVQNLERQPKDGSPTQPSGDHGHNEEPDTPKDQLDDIPFG